MSRATLTVLLLLLAGPTVGLAQSEPPAAGSEVTIFSSRANQAVIDKEGGDYRAGIKLWSQLCQQAGLSFRIAGDYEFETEPAPSRAYVIHRADRLTAAQRENLRKLQSRGAALILVGMTGSQDEAGQPQASLAEEWLELSDLRPYQPKECAYFSFLAPGPLHASVPPGFRFEFQWQGSYHIAATRHAAAANVDWLLQPYPNTKSFQANATAALRTLDRSRIAWLGVPPEFVSNVDNGDKELLPALTTLLLWAARKPVVALCPWEGCRRTATVITADIEDKFRNGEAIALACHKEKVRGSFFLVGKLAPDFPETVLALALNGEIGTHSVKHNSFKGQPLAEQLAEIQEGRDGLLKMGIMEVAGFRPPMEEYDQNTLIAAARAGLAFVYGNLDYHRAYPVRLEIEGRHLYQFARVVADDYNIADVRKAVTPDDYQREFTSEYLRISHLGGLFPFSFHTNYLANQETVDVIRSLVAFLKGEDSWITTFSEIVAWIEFQELIKLRTSQDQEVTTVVVENGNPIELKGYSVQLFRPLDGGPLTLIDTPEAGISLTQAGGGATIIKVDLRAGESRTIKLR